MTRRPVESQAAVLLLLGLLACESRDAGPPAAEAIPEPRLLSCFAFRPDTSAAVLESVFGASNVANAEIDVGEGNTESGTVLFAASPEERVEILWKDPAARARPRSVRIRGAASRWSTPHGLALGLRLQEVERLNGRAFRLLGFEWDYAGTVMSWDGGKLETAPGDRCRVRARLNPESGDEEWRRQVLGDTEFSSGHPAMRALDPRVYEIWLEYPEG
jgi:hypothetical protein